MITVYIFLFGWLTLNVRQSAVVPVNIVAKYICSKAMH
jgi:hypothetical protein